MRDAAEEGRRKKTKHDEEKIVQTKVHKAANEINCRLPLTSSNSTSASPMGPLHLMDARSLEGFCGTKHVKTALMSVGSSSKACYTPWAATQNGIKRRKTRQPDGGRFKVFLLRRFMLLITLFPMRRCTSMKVCKNRCAYIGLHGCDLN